MSSDLNSPIDWNRVVNDPEYRDRIDHPPDLNGRKLERALSENPHGFWKGYPGPLNNHQLVVLKFLNTTREPSTRAMVVNHCKIDKERVGKWVGLKDPLKRDICERVTGVVSLVTRGYAEIVTDNVPPGGQFAYVITQKGREFLRGTTTTTTESPPVATVSSDSDSPSDTAVVQEEEYWEPEACDIVAPPDRVECTTTRIIRSSALALEVKQRHNFECQICGETIELPDGRRYAEAHHIQPLGGEHGGVDTIENMLCLCPNHHAEFDLGAREIELDSLRSAPGHNVDPVFVEYHNGHIAIRD